MVIWLIKRRHTQRSSKALRIKCSVQAITKTRNCTITDRFKVISSQITFSELTRQAASENLRQHFPHFTSSVDAVSGQITFLARMYANEQLTLNHNLHHILPTLGEYPILPALWKLMIFGDADFRKAKLNVCGWLKLISPPLGGVIQFLAGYLRCLSYFAMSSWTIRELLQTNNTYND